LILTLNSGSSSLKYALFDYTSSNLEILTSGKIEFTISSKLEASPAIAVKEVIERLSQTKHLSSGSITAIGCRVVHGGHRFVAPTIISVDTLAEIRSLGILAPLHNPLAADVIENCTKVFPEIPAVAVFDTAFHQSIPAVASTYAIPQTLSASNHIRRYGFHGIAHQQVSERLQTILGHSPLPSRLITCHLGNGASVCAVLNGQSIDTSMGFTPMEGLIMGSRSGDIDPGLVLYMLNELNLSASEVDHLLNHQSGLLGLSGISNDVRFLDEQVLKGNHAAEFALECFAYRVAKYIGAYVSVLNGVDAIAFSGGVGENSSPMRERITKRLGCFGFELDIEANHLASGKEAACITLSKGRSSAWVIHANEELQIAKETSSLMQKYFCN